MRKADGYSLLSPVYDALAATFFFGAIKKSQLTFLNELPSKGHILILGGGTGWILEEIGRHRPDLEVWYVEKSLVMLRRSRKRALQKNMTVHWVWGLRSDLAEGIKYDAVITSFYLDLFSKKDLLAEIAPIASQMSSDGKWLVADFEENGRGLNRHYQRLMTGAMLLFFKWTTGHPGKSLPHIRQLLSEAGLLEDKVALMHGGFIFSALYQKAIR